MGDCWSALDEGFREGMAEVFNSEETVHILEKRAPDEVKEAARRAVRLAMAPFLWDARLGQMLETAQVCEQLEVSRQAVAKAVDAGRLVAIPAGNTRKFPVWQFSFGQKTEIRGEVAQVLSAFWEVYPETRPLQVAGWAMTTQPELENEMPSTWLEKAGTVEPLLLSARRTASKLAQ